MLLGRSGSRKKSESRTNRFRTYNAVAALFLLLLLLGAFLGPFLWDVDPNAQTLARRLEDPTWSPGDAGMFGWDQLGRPVLARVMHGLRTSYSVALGAVAIGGAIGTTIGGIGAFIGGRSGNALLRIVDVQMAIPALLIVMVMNAIIGGGALVLTVLLGIVSWIIYARLVAVRVASVKEQEYVTASRLIGVRERVIFIRHVVPQAIPVVATAASFELANAMLNEAGLSFLGFGIESPQVSLGAMMAEGLQFLYSDPWLSVIPGAVLASAILATNVTATWIREVLDPTTDVT